MRIRRILRVLVVAAGIVVVLLIATIGLLHTRTAKNLALEQLQKFLAAQDIAIEVTDFDYGFTPLRVSTGRVSMKKISTPDLPRFFSADSFTGIIRLNDLIHSRYRIEDVKVDKPVIHIFVDEQHRNNIPGSSDKPKKSTEAIDLRIVKLRSAGGSFILDDRSQKLFLNFPVWDLSMDSSGTSDTEEFQLRTGPSGEIRFSGKTISMNSVVAKGALKQRYSMLDLHNAQLTSVLGEIVLTGTIANLSDPQINLSMAGDVHLKPVRQFLSITENIQGDLHVEMAATGRPKDLQMKGRVSGSPLDIDRFRDVAFNTDLAVDIGSSRVRLTSLRARSSNMSLSGNADVAFTAAAGESRIDGRFDVTDLQRLLRLYEIPTPVASRVAGSVRANWPGMDVGRFKGTGQVQLSAKPPARAEEIPVAGIVNVTARGDRLTASIDELHSGALHLTGQVNLQTRKQVGGTVRLDVTDMAQALPQVAGWFGGSIPADLQLSGPAVIDANLDGTLDHLRIGTNIAANGLRLNSLENIQLDAAAEYTPEQVDVSRFSVQWEAESITGNGKIGLATADPTLDGQATMSNTSVHRVLAALGKPETPVAGNVDVAATVSGTVKSPIVAAKVSASDLQAFGESLGSLSAEASLRNDVAQLDSLTLTKTEGGVLQASGRYEITSGSYALDMNGSDLHLTGLVLPQGTAIRGNVNLNAQGRGTVENPGGVIQLNVRDLRVDSKDLRSVDLNVNLADHLARITAGAPFFGVRANASVGTARPYAAEVELHVEDAEVSRFPAEKLKDLSGRITANVNATGNLSDIPGVVARAEVPKLQLDWRNHAITNDMPIQLSYANRELTISQADIRYEESTVHLAGNIPLEGSVGQLKVDGRASLADIASLIPQETPIEAKGQLLLNGSLRGNLKRIDPDLTITLSDGSVESAVIIAPLREANLKAVARDGRVVVEQLTAKWGDARVSAQGETTLAILPDLPIEIPRPDSPVRLSVDVDQFKLSSMTRPPANTDGTISLNIEAQALRHDINTVQLRVRFPDLKFNAGVFALEQVGISSIDVRDGIASVGQFQLTGPQTNIRLSGTADLRKSGPIDVQLKGDTDAAVLALFSKAAKGTGTARLNVDVRGTVQEPMVNGYVELQDGQAKIDSPRLAAENVQVRIDLNGDRIDVTRLEGTLNGGTIRGEGHIHLTGAQRGEMNLSVSGDGIYMEFPVGLKTVSNAQIRIDGTYPALAITGKVDVEEGAYTEPLRVGRGLMKFFSEDTGTTYVVNDSVDLKDTRLDISVRTLSPITVNNNIAQGEIDAELRLLGTIEEPGLTGKIEVDEGARLYLRERKYSVDRGLITFANEHAIEPILDVAATTTVKASGSDYDITMKISGDVTRKLDTDLTSSPPLDEGDIVSVLATGRTRNEASSQGADVAKEQVLSFIAGDLGSSFTSEAGRAIGLSQVRIDPTTIGTTKKTTSSSSSATTSNPAEIGNETEPTARLTLGKDVTPQLSLVYSMNLRNSSDQMWVAEYDVTRRFSTSAIRQEDNSFRVQAQHDLLFGLPSDADKTATSLRRKIGSIQFSGNMHLSTGKLSSAVGLKTGKSYDFFSVQKGRERLEKTLEEDDRLESRISVERKTVGSTVDLVFHIMEGPQVKLVYEGWDVSNDLNSEIRKAWSGGVIDIQRTDDAVDLIESALIKERYFGFHVDSAIEMSTDEAKSVVFNIQPGSQYDELRVGFEGVRSVRESDLQALLKAVGYFNQGPREREQALPAIEALYRERGYLDVKVEPPSGQLDELSRTLTTIFPITEGGLYHFGEVRFQGNTEFKSELLLMTTKIGPETVFQVSTVIKARQALQELYRKSGYNDATVLFSQVKDVSRKSIDISFNIQEGRQRVLREVQVEGNQKTSNGLVRSQLALEPGDILSDEKLSVARTNLYDSGAYAFVDIDVSMLESSPDLKPNQVPVRLLARVREVQPWELKYGGYVDSERGLGVITDFSNRNMLGHARVLGMQVRFDADLREGRMYFSQPVLRRFPVRSLFSAFISHEELTDSDSLRTTITNKKGLSPSFEYKFRKSNTISLGYRLEMTHEFTAVPDPAFPDSLVRTAPVTTSFSRDTRDDPFDATEGHFTSHATDWGTATLGSDLHYFKYFGQFFDYLRLGKPTVVPWTKEVRNRLLLAYGVRIGILKGAPFQDFRTEQFKTGGGTTVRGFEQDKLGPLDADRNPLGGDAELILNTELRFPLYKFFDGVAFVDAGNVYPKLQDFSPFDVRASYGFGIRIRTPYLLFRFDYGIKMNPKSGESKGQFFFSFGQAF